jgi:hypothetical protein
MYLFLTESATYKTTLYFVTISNLYIIQSSLQDLRRTATSLFGLKKILNQIIQPYLSDYASK